MYQSSSSGIGVKDAGFAFRVIAGWHEGLVLSGRRVQGFGFEV